MSLPPSRFDLQVCSIVLVMCTLGCSRRMVADPPGPEPMPVVATTGMIADAVRQVGGPHVRVEALMGPGVDPHRFAPSAGDLGKLSRARMVFFNGLHLEGKMADVLKRSAGRKAVAVTRGLDPSRDLRRTADGDGHDPHVWFDVRLWMRCVETIRDALIEEDPAHAADYKVNGSRHLAELAGLDAEVRAKAEAVPRHRRVLVTGHDAFRYFGAAYGFEVHGLQGVSTAAEATTKDVQDLAHFLGTRRVPAVFAETSVPNKGLQAVIDAARQKYGHEVRLVGSPDALYSDSLGELGTPAETYVGMVRHNIAVIVEALK